MRVRPGCAGVWQLSAGESDLPVGATREGLQSSDLFLLSRSSSSLRSSQLAGLDGF